MTEGVDGMTGQVLRQQDTGDDAREQLLAGLPVVERRLELAGVSTPVWEGGSGTPVVLLHGPGEFAGYWLRVVPGLVRAHRVVVPDLPGHGASDVRDGPLTGARVIDWLGDLLDRTVSEPPVLVGRVVGGAVAARFAADHGNRLRHLVLVDALGLSSFRPAPPFEQALHRFLAEPDEHNYDRLMRHCAHDLDTVTADLGQQWTLLQRYAIEVARVPAVQAAIGALLAEFGMAPLPDTVLRRIDVPTTLVWGRHDMATSLDVAEATSARYGWPLRIVEEAADDPALEAPEEFVQLIRAAAESAR
jgi:pimeloyl-ACP methyl ester carboxylesterase